MKSSAIDATQARFLRLTQFVHSLAIIVFLSGLFIFIRATITATSNGFYSFVALNEFDRASADLSDTQWHYYLQFLSLPCDYSHIETCQVCSYRKRNRAGAAS